MRLHSGEAGKADWDSFRLWRAQSGVHEAAAAEADALWSDASEVHRDPATGLIRPGRRRPVVSRRGIITGIAGLGAIGASGLWATGAWRPFGYDYSTGIAETHMVELPDGSRMTLNAMSAVRLDFSPQRRRVLLVEGQAYFEVAPDARRPFEVEARGNIVKALGTAFDVNSNLPRGAVAVAVVEHAVTVGAASASSRNAEAVVSEGEGVVVAANGHVGPISRLDAGAATAWRSGMYVAEGRPLDEVVETLRAYRRGWIVIRDENTRSLKVNAVLDLRHPEASLKALAGGLPIRILQLTPLLIIISQV